MSKEYRKGKNKKNPNLTISLHSKKTRWCIQINKYINLILDWAIFSFISTSSEELIRKLDTTRFNLLDKNKIRKKNEERGKWTLDAEVYRPILALWYNYTTKIKNRSMNRCLQWLHLISILYTTIKTNLDPKNSKTDRYMNRRSET